MLALGVELWARRKVLAFAGVALALLAFGGWMVHRADEGAMTRLQSQITANAAAIKRGNVELEQAKQTQAVLEKKDAKESTVRVVVERSVAETHKVAGSRNPVDTAYAGVWLEQLRNQQELECGGTCPAVSDPAEPSGAMPAPGTPERSSNPGGSR